MEELRQRAADEVRVEEMKQNYRQEMQEAKTEKSDVKKEAQGSRPGSTKAREGPRGPRFQQYT